MSLDIRQLLLRLNKERNMTIVLSSHLLHEVEQICNRVCIIDQGKIIYQGHIDSLKEQSNCFWIDSNDRSSLQVALDQLNIELQTHTDKGFLVKLTSISIAELNTALHNQNISLIKIEAVQTSLEDSFLRLTEEE